MAKTPKFRRTYIQRSGLYKKLHWCVLDHVVHRQCKNGGGGVNSCLWFLLNDLDDCEVITGFHQNWT